MKLLNKSARPHWVGGVLIVPGQIANVADTYRGAFNAAELEEVAEAPVEAPVEVAEPEAPAKTAPRVVVKNGKTDESENVPA